MVDLAGGWRQDRPNVGGQSTAAQRQAAAHRRARIAEQYWQSGLAEVVRTRQVVVESLCAAARAHERAAETSERLAVQGRGDVAELSRRALFHRAAAEADRKRAEELKRLKGGGEPPALVRRGQPSPEKDWPWN